MRLVIRNRYILNHTPIPFLLLVSAAKNKTNRLGGCFGTCGYQQQQRIQSSGWSSCRSPQRCAQIVDSRQYLQIVNQLFKRLNGRLHSHNSSNQIDNNSPRKILHFQAPESHRALSAKQKPNVLTSFISALSISLFSASPNTTVHACTRTTVLARKGTKPSNILAVVFSLTGAYSLV